MLPNRRRVWGRRQCVTLEACLKEKRGQSAAMLDYPARPRRRILLKLFLGLAAFVGAVLIFNGSWWAAPPQGTPKLIAHRGVHQEYRREELERDTCTATRIFPPTHEFIENTLPSMAAAFEAGADIVEIDVHPTTDGQMAVMHDWTLDCRTEGKGDTRKHDMAYLKTLDLGYGYTADDGATFPLRGKGIGMMPELKEVLAAFPDKHFLINFKGRWAKEGDMLAALAEAHPGWRSAIWGAYGDGGPTLRAAALMPGLKQFTKAGVKDCLINYAAYGWTGMVPEACKGTSVMVPVNVAPYLWGWPNLFLQRMREAGSEVILLGPWASGDPGTMGIDTEEQLSRVPDGFDGYIWTNKIELVGPLVRP